jgi:small subunit ribosomal protein S8
MTMTDPIADMLTRIRNANTVHHDSVNIPASKIKLAMAEILKQEGFIREYELKKISKQGTIRVYLKYGPHKEKVISGLKRISKPGCVFTPKRMTCPRCLAGWE